MYVRVTYFTERSDAENMESIVSYTYLRTETWEGVCLAKKPKRPKGPSLLVTKIGGWRGCPASCGSVGRRMFGDCGSKRLLGQHSTTNGG